jgi:hypothetical protein
MFEGLLVKLADRFETLMKFPEVQISLRGWPDNAFEIERSFGVTSTINL